jgi:O-antigen/teichoic acid export membrane protein
MDEPPMNAPTAKSAAGGILFGISATWVQTGAALLINLVQVPLLYRYLPRDAMGAWMIFASIGLFLLLWDLGLGVTFARSMAYARGRRQGEPPAARDADTCPADLLRTVSLTYWALAAALFLMALGAGWIYLGHLKFDVTPFQTVWLAWVVYAFGCAVNLGAATPFHCLNGLGDVGIEQLLGTVCNLLALAANIIVLVSGAGIVALSLVFVARGFVARAAAWIILKRRHTWLFERTGRFSLSRLKPLSGDSLRILVTRLGAFLVLQTPGLIIAQLMGPRRVPDFVATWMIVQLGMTAGMAVGQAVTPNAAAAHAAGDPACLLRLHRNACTAALFLMSLWCLGYLLWAREGMTLWLGPGHFLGYGVLVPMLITGTLEVHHSINANFVWSLGRWPFAPWALVAGALNLGLGIWWVSCFARGEAGMAWATCAAQALTNNWFVVYDALRRLNVPVKRYAREVLAPVSGIILASAAVALAVKTGLPRVLDLAGAFRGLPITDLVGMILGAAATVSCAFALFWRLAIDNDARGAVRFQVRRLAARSA